jgi:hypothetical protein
MEGLPDMCEGSGGFEARNARNCRVRSDVEENLLTRPVVIQAHLEPFGCHKTPSPHDQFGAGRLVLLQMDLQVRLWQVIPDVKWLP